MGETRETWERSSDDRVGNALMRGNNFTRQAEGAYKYDVRIEEDYITRR